MKSISKFKIYITSYNTSLSNATPKLSVIYSDLYTLNLILAVPKVEIKCKHKTLIKIRSLAHLSQIHKYYIIYLKK